jgi:hypothetical protein
VIEVISEEYLNLQKDLHLRSDYGTASLGIAPEVKKIFEENKLTSISDYGAGKCNLQKKLIQLGLKDFDYFPYDPVFPEYGSPKKADLVCCIDVLEHIEEFFIENVINELRNITDKLAYFTIALKPAGKILKDGRNAHILLRSEDWWLNLIKSKFNFKEVNKHPKRLKLLLC